MDRISELEKQLEQEREKVKGLEDKLDLFLSAEHIMTVSWKGKVADRDKQLADLQTVHSQLQALVRALPEPEEGGFPIVEVDGDYYVNHTSRFSTKAEADAYTGLLIYRAALDSMTPDSNQLGDINDMVSKGGDGE